MIRSFLTAILMTCVSLTASAWADEKPLQLMWNDLVPQFEPLKNPILDLPLEDREDLAYLAALELDIELGFIEKGSESYQTTVELRADLLERGLDIEGLKKIADDMNAELDRRNAATRQDLSGQFVRLPGYALPLEFSETGVQEFLLVPYVGACIHSPPPPPNQTVFVELAEAYTVESLYEPVWITGKLKIEPSSRALFFVDGQADVATGYTLQGITVEPYE